MVCPNCHAVAADDARFCGICGTALPPSPASLVQSRASAPPTWSETPTQPQTAFPPIPGTSREIHPSPPYARAPVAPPASAAPRRSRGWQMLIAFAVIIVVLFVGWFGLLRPALHRAAVSGLNAALANAVQVIPQSALLSGKSGHITLTDADLAAAIAQAGDTRPLSDVQAHFVTGTLDVSFKLWGFGNQIAIGLASSQGAVAVTHIAADGPITLVLTANDIASSLAQALSTVDQRLQGITISSLTIAPNLLTISFQS
jgi:hypothetical protein